MIKGTPKKPEIGIVKKQDISENQVNYAYLALGSNLGNKVSNLIKTNNLILENNIKIVKSSSFYKTDSWPNNKFPFYINSVILVKTSMKALELLDTLKLIESKIGRKKAKKNFPRICDIDIIDFNGKIFNFVKENKNLVIPHRSMHFRNFVLFPLFEISKTWTHPIFKKNIADLISSLSISDLRSIKII